MLAQVLALSGAEAEALAEIDAVCEAPAENPVTLCASSRSSPAPNWWLALRSNADASEADLRAALVVDGAGEAGAGAGAAAAHIARQVAAAGQGETDAAREVL